MSFKINWTSLIVGGKIAVYALFYFVFKGNFPYYKPPGGLYLEGPCNGGFFTLAVWGPYIWRGLFSEFYGMRFKISSFSCGPTDTAIHALNEKF